MAVRSSAALILMGAALGAGALPGGPAFAADLAVDAAAPSSAAPQPYLSPPYVFNPIDEVRVGGFAHNWIHNENAPVDVSVEVLSSPILFPGGANPWVAGNPWVSWFFNPRLNLGGMINTGGKTSYAFGGFVWRIPIVGKFFFEGELGGAVNNAVRTPTVDRVDMGCAVTFRESGGFGYQFNENWDAVASIEHVSHASFCTKINPGLTQVGLRIGYKF